MARTRPTLLKSPTHPAPKKKKSSSSQLKKQPLVEEVELPTVLPEIPVPVRDFLKYVEANPGVPIRELLEPYLEYETALRAYFAQKPDHEFVQGNVNLISLFKDENARLVKTRARNLAQETEEESEKYIMALKNEDRKDSGEHVLVESLKEFRDNFNVFSEGSLLNMDWSNVVVAGSAVLTPLLKVPEKWAESKRSLREYYHQKLAPASDIDLFIHGIDDPEEAIKKMEQIERTIKDNILWETTTLRTRNTITIVSQYPNRHVQIVLRLYKSPSQILTGFDVNCSCFAYDGANVLANPRALGACITQCNDIDLTRRSPSYENRLSKYSHRGFEVYCDFLDRSRIDPTIFERSFQKTVGLARLLVLEALPKPEDREAYVIQRRQEMGRPQKEFRGIVYQDKKDIKQRVNDEVAEWDFEDISGYQKFSIPYGEGHTAKRTEKLFFKKDLLLNAEWNPMNRPPNREVALHRHPVFFGDVKEVVGDCCGFCLEPVTDEEKEVYEEESKIYVSGPITFLHDDPGRQEIGSFYPLGPEDYTDMAYVGSTEVLCEAIVENNVEYVKNWVSQEGVDVNRRDFCGRTPLHLACISTGTGLEILQILVDAGARLVARLQDGRTALHLAAASGRLDIVKILMDKSLKNQAEKEEKEERKAEVEKAAKGEDPEQRTSYTQKETTDLVMREADDGGDDAEEGEDQEGSYDKMSDEEESEEGDEEGSEEGKTTTTQGFIKVKPEEEPDVYDEEEEGEDDDIYDINVVDWDHGMAPIHHAIICGHKHIVEALVSSYGADCLLPMKKYQYSQSEGKRPSDAILNLALVHKIKDVEKRASMAACLLKLGASSAQANSFNNTTAFHYAVIAAGFEVLDTMFELDKPGVMSVIDNLAGKRAGYNVKPTQTPLISALYYYDQEKYKKMVYYLLDHGAKGKVDLESYLPNLNEQERKLESARQQFIFGADVAQPIEIAMYLEGASDLIQRLISAGADINQITQATYDNQRWNATLPVFGKTILELLRERINHCRKFLKSYKPPGRNRWRERVVFSPEVLDGIEPGTYIRYCAERYLVDTNEAREKHNKKGPPPENDLQKNAAETQKAAVEKLLDSLRETEKILVFLGAKTYHELLPEKKELAIQEKAKNDNGGLFGFVYDSNSPNNWDIEQLAREEEEYKKDCCFLPQNQVDIPYLGEGDVQAGYRRLFEAIWRGTPEDAAIVKELTLGPSGEGENKLPALRMAVVDSYGRSTLFVALRNRNWEMAKLILAIVQEQYEVPEEESAGKRYILASDEDEDDEIISTKADNEFTIENVGVRKGLTKCSISPLKYLSEQNLNASTCIDREEYDKLVGSGAFSGLLRWSLLSWAIYKDDMEMFRFLLKLADDCEEGGSSKFIDYAGDFCTNAPYGCYRSHARLALALGRIKILEELMKTEPFGIPFKELEESDEEMQMQRPEFYQGLTVHGKKRKDWASSSYPAYGTEDDRKHKPAHIAVSYGNLASIKWLLSEKPYEYLKEFMAANPNHIRAKILKKQGDGLGFTLQKGLGVETRLLPFLAIKRWSEKYPMETFRFLLSRPGALEARTNNSLNLALYAVSRAAQLRQNIPVLKELMKPEYDIGFFARDGWGRNVLHYALSCNNYKDMKKILEMLPEEVHEVAWTQRSLGKSQTPLAEWLERTGCSRLDTLRLILKYSKGQDLGIADAEGNLPLHWSYQHALPGSLIIFTEMAPQYTHYENANGRTPMEIAASSFLSNVYCNPPEGPTFYQRVPANAVDKQLYDFYPPGVPRFGGYSYQAVNNPESMDVDETDDEEEPKDGVTWKEDKSDLMKTYELGTSYLKKYPGKRKLVSLNDANELARRVASMKAGSYKTEGEGEEEGFNGGDILQFW